MNGKRILLVDNMELALKMEEEILRRSGLEILTARSGSEALALTKSQKPDLVLLEQNMPEMSGGECCRQIKMDPELQHIPVLLMLSDSSEPNIELAFASNCEEILVKPLDQALVVEKITNLIQLQTRKYARLNLATSIRIDREGQMMTAESVNLNRKGVLVKSEQGFTPAFNYLLTFSLSPADQALSVWCRLDRLVAPGTEKNPGNQFLALFRFLNLPEALGDRIDRLADFQSKQVAKEAARPQIGQNFAPIYAFLQKSVDDYVGSLKTLVKNVGQVIAGFSSDEQTLLQVATASLKIWEKKALSGSSEEDQILSRALALRLKLTCDQKKLERLGSLTSDDQGTLRELQKTYFAMSDQVFDALQTQINARMQAGQVDLMKQINQTKTDSFRNYVSIKALMNRLLDPGAAAQAKQFQYQAQDDENYKQTAFDRPKPKEEAAKKEEYTFSSPQQQKKGKPYIKIALVLALLCAAPVLYEFVSESSRLSYIHEHKGISIPLRGTYPIEQFRPNGKLLLVTVTKDWESLSGIQRRDMVQNLFAEVKANNYDALTVVYGSQVVAYANAKEGVKIN